MKIAIKHRTNNCKDYTVITENLTEHTTLLSSIFLFGELVHLYSRSSATAEIVRVGGRYAIRGHARSLMLVPIESLLATCCE